MDDSEEKHKLHLVITKITHTIQKSDKKYHLGVYALCR